MINPATRPHDELNEFTSTVSSFLNPNNDYGRKHYRVKLRNGDLVQPIFKAAENAFFAEKYMMRWYPDGTSVVRPALDMMELVRV